MGRDTEMLGENRWKGSDNLGRDGSAGGVQQIVQRPLPECRKDVTFVCVSDVERDGHMMLLDGQWRENRTNGGGGLPGSLSSDFARHAMPTGQPKTPH